jgi:hypothetical protein
MVPYGRRGSWTGASANSALKRAHSRIVVRSPLIAYCARLKPAALSMQTIQSRNPVPSQKRRFHTALLIVITGGLVLALRQGAIPALLNPLPAVDLGQANAWFVDWRLAALKYQPNLCKRVLTQPHIEAQLISDVPLKDGCGWINAVRMSAAGGAHVGFDKLTCEAAAALAMWIEHEVQPAAQQFLGQRVTALQSYGGYSCRDVVGNPLLKGWRSEHATANAADIRGFTLADGRHISVQRDWRGGWPEAKFLKAVHAGACRYFHVALSPDYNAAHRDHFHLDRGILWRCK